MGRSAKYFATLISIAGAGGLRAAPPDGVEKVTSPQIVITADVESSGPVESIELWVTSDEGATWIRHGAVGGGGTSIAFDATTEGLYGFYLIAENEAGASSPPPDATTEAHQWVFVDLSSPIVQLHPIEQDDPPVLPAVVHIKWSALDNALSARPVVLSYRAASQESWETIGDRMANAGAFDWRVPDGVEGEVSVRVTVRDEAGHVGEVVSEPFRIKRPSTSDHPSPTLRFAKLRREGVEGAPVESETPKSGEDDRDRRLRAFKLYQQGRLHSLRSEYKLAASRLRDALSVEPALTEALVELGRVLYAQGEPGQAIEAYELALSQRPGLRDALEGLALAYIGEHRFPDAVRELSRIVQANPRDAEAWLNLGDIAIYQGDELLAREHYEKAMTLEPTATDVIAKAKLRMADLKRLAAEFRQTEPMR